MDQDSAMQEIADIKTRVTVLETQVLSKIDSLESMVKKLFERAESSRDKMSDCQLQMKRDISDQYSKKIEIELLMAKRNEAALKRREHADKDLNDKIKRIHEKIESNDRKFLKYQTIISTVIGGAVVYKYLSDLGML